METKPLSASAIRKQKQKLRQQGIDPDTVVIERKRPGPARQPTASFAAKKKRQYRDKRRQVLQAAPQRQQQTMSFLNMFSSSKTPEERIFAQANATFNRSMTNIEQATANEAKEAEAALERAKAQTKEAETALERAKSTRIREESLLKALDVLQRATPKKKQPSEAYDNEEEEEEVENLPPATLTKPTPSTASREKADEQEKNNVPIANLIEPTPRKASRKKAAPTPGKNRDTTSFAALLEEYKNNDGILRFLTKEKVGTELTDSQVKIALIFCLENNYIIAKKTRSRRNKLGHNVLDAFCLRLMDIDDIELNYEDLEYHAVAELLLDYHNGVL